MRIHLIAIGGSAMHNIALALYYNHHTVSGSDDEVYNPARDRLAKHGLLPEKIGWNPDCITKDLDLVILGMHARPDNPELKRAQELNIPIYSYPAFVYEKAKEQKRVVIAGSHGKTTTTSMVMHVLKFHLKDFDYLVGAQLDGFETMVRFSDAQMTIIEGDEYLSSPMDRRPKFLHYLPDLAVITGIAWDHINVFPDFSDYKNQFLLFAQSMPPSGKLFYYQHDPYLPELLDNADIDCELIPYHGFNFKVENNQTILITDTGKEIPLKIFGAHNLQNLQAAFFLCLELGISSSDFFKAIKSFKGAAKRLDFLCKTDSAVAYKDFAHAPSKVKATTEAMKAQYPKRQLIACVELHTFSSLNKEFLPHYKTSLAAADQAFVFYSEHTLKMKKLPQIKPSDIQNAFNHPNLTVIQNDFSKLENALNRFDWKEQNLLLMTSGNFGGWDMKKAAKFLLIKN